MKILHLVPDCIGLKLTNNGNSKISCQCASSAMFGAFSSQKLVATINWYIRAAEGPSP